MRIRQQIKMKQQQHPKIPSIRTQIISIVQYKSRPSFRKSLRTQNQTRILQNSYENQNINIKNISNVQQFSKNRNRISKQYQHIITKEQNSKQAKQNNNDKHNQHNMPFLHRSSYQHNVQKQNVNQNSHKQQKIVNVKNSTQIRQQIDQNLSNIYRELQNRRFSSDLRNNTISQSAQLSGPKLQRNLVRQYLQMIYNEYQIPKQERHSYEQSDILQQLSPIQSTKFHNQSTFMQQTTNRKSEKMVKNLRNSSNQAKKLKNKMRNFLQTQQDTQIQKIQSYNESNRKFNKLIKIKQIFRYCLVCQKPILQANIQYHQNLQCPSLKLLYRKSVNELREAIVNKIVKVKSSYENLLNNNKQNILNKSMNFQHNSKQFLISVQQTLSKNNENQTDDQKNSEGIQLHQKFNRTVSYFQQIHLKAYKQLLKLQWFVIMLNNLNSYFNQNKQILKDSLQFHKIIKVNQYIKQNNHAQRRFSLV